MDDTRRRFGRHRLVHLAVSVASGAWRVREDRSVRTRACYLAIGVTVGGEREVLGIWWQVTEGAKF
jgi:transposase-like protein